MQQDRRTYRGAVKNKQNNVKKDGTHSVTIETRWEKQRIYMFYKSSSTMNKFITQIE